MCVSLASPSPENRQLRQTSSWCPTRRPRLASSNRWAEAIKTGGRFQLRSRNDKDFNRKYPAIVQALTPMPDETVIDGEIIALDDLGRPSFNEIGRASCRGRGEICGVDGCGID